MSKYTEIPITFEKGLALSSEASVLDMGNTAELTNWTPEATGGLRVRPAWKAASTTGTISGYSPWQSRGLGVYSEQRIPRIVQYVRSGPQQPIYFTSTQITFTCDLPDDPTIGNTLVFAFICYDSYSGSNFNLTTPGWTTQMMQSMGNYAVGGFVTKTVTAATARRSQLTFTTQTGQNIGGSWILYEVTDIEGGEVNGVTGSGYVGTSPLNVTTTSTLGATGITFSEVWEQYSGSYPSSSTSTKYSGDNEYSPSNLWSPSHWVGDYQSRGQVTETFTSSPTSYDLGGLTWAVDATRAEEFSKNIVDIIAVDDVPPDLTTWSWTNVASIGDATNATTYSLFSTGALTLNAVYVLWIANEKGTTADEPTPTCATGGLDGTWTKVSTNLFQSETRRVSTYWQIPNSTTASTVTANFGVGNTQTRCIAGLARYTPTNAAHMPASPTSQYKTASGTGTNLTVTFDNPRDLHSVSALITVANTTTSSQLSTDQPGVTEMHETQATGENFGGAMYTTDDVEDTMYATCAISVNWDVVALELLMGSRPNGYRAYKLNTADPEGADWATIDESDNSPSPSSLVKTCEGAGSFVWSGTGMEYARKYVKTTGVGTDITDISPGRAICFHKNRVFIGGTNANPSRLYFSDLNSPSSYPASNYIDVSADDGDAIEDVISTENILLIAKTNSIWQLSGSGVESFFLAQLPGGSACPGRPLCTTPYGTISAGRYTVWSVQGGGVDPISRPIAGEYEIVGNVSTGYSNDKAYILDSANGTIWVCNLLTGAWHKESLGDVDNGPLYMRDITEQLFFGTPSGTTTPLGFTPRGTPERGADFSPHTVNRSMTTPMLFLSGPNYTYTPRHLFLQVRRHGNPAPMTVTVTVPDGATTLSRDWEITSGPPVSRERLDVGFAAGKAWIQISASEALSAESTSMEIERMILGVDAELYR